MGAGNVADHRSPGIHRPAGFRDCLRELRTGVAGHLPGEALERLLGNVSEAVERISVENTGMAEELLCVYEQLGIVFEVTRRLPGVHSESEVIDLFVDSLHRSYQKREVFVVQQHPQTLEARSDSRDRSDDWFRSLLKRTRESGAVLVESPPAGAATGLVAELMAGPIFAGESYVCTIVLSRRADVESFQAGDMSLLESLTMFCGDLIRNHRLARELREMSMAVVRSLVNAVDQKDQYTSGHSLRVGYYATHLGKALGLGSEDLQMLQWSALLHDVGKIGIRDNVLKKAGALTREEFDHIKEHPVRSHKLVKDVPQLLTALDGVLHHHERFDGNGYPSGLSGENIPLQARIIQVADIFDALTSDRAYRPAYDWQEALDIMESEAGETIDPQLQKTFDHLIREALQDDAHGWAKIVRRAGHFTLDSEDQQDAPDEY